MRAAQRSNGSEYAIYAADALACHYNVASVVFAHALTANPLFQLDSLTRLALRRERIPGGVYCSSGRVSPQDSWNTGTGVSAVHDSLTDIATGDSLVVIKGVEQDVQYAPAASALMTAIRNAAGPRMSGDATRGRATIFLASPHRVTTYHVDADTNFLFQLQGSKDFYVYPDARSLLPADQLESFFSGNLSAAKLREADRTLETHYVLHPTSAIHVPFLAPHWARNRAEVSIALSVNFDMRSAVKLGRLYRLNHRLRRLGLHPRPPGDSRLGDAVKQGIGNVAATLKHLVSAANSSGRPI
jgi:hypothetical protein